MPEPIVEQIRQNLLTVLGGITTGNSYQYTLNVQSAARHGNPATDLTCILEMGDEQIVDDDSGRGANLQDTQFQSFFVFVHVSTQSGVAYDQKCNRIVADVRKAVLADWSRGGLALWTRRQEASFFLEDTGKVGGVRIDFLVNYRHRLNDPYTQ